MNQINQDYNKLLAENQKLQSQLISTKGGLSDPNLKMELGEKYEELDDMVG
jgi:hypothetical protein